MRQPGIVILDEATSALDSSNETSLYARLRASDTTLISIAHRAAVLRHHTHVLRLLGDGAWELHAASGYQFDSPVSGETDKLPAKPDNPQDLSQAPSHGLALA